MNFQLKPHHVLLAINVSCSSVLGGLCYPDTIPFMLLGSRQAFTNLPVLSLLII
jgi:hypothetical protein